MEASLRILMEGLIDYAGLFPPASLDMDAAVRNYAAYRKGPEAAWLGRFVVPAARLGEFGKSLAGAAAAPVAPGAEEPWRLSALIGADLQADLSLIETFRRSGDKAVVDTLEMKADRPEQIQAAMERIPKAITPYFEVPIQDNLDSLLAAIARAGGRAKVRTGGVTEGAFPAPARLARFIKACARSGLTFKATAGLHHPVRSLRKLTYDPDSPRAVMHGFLNVFLAAAFAVNGMDEAALADLLQEESPRAFAFTRDEAAWRGHRLTLSKLTAARRDFATAFGSCSFEEPREDLQEAGLL